MARKNRKFEIAGAAGFLAGGLLMFDGALDVGDVGPYRFGLTVVALSGTALVAGRCRTSTSMLERARQDGYDDGYVDGCEITRPSRVVALESSRHPSRGALTGAAHQLRKQRHLGRGAKRVG